MCTIFLWHNSKCRFKWGRRCDVITERQRRQTEKMADLVNVGVNLDAFSHAISGIQALRSSVTRVFESLKDGMKNRATLEGREKQFIAEFQDNLQAVNRDLKWVRHTRMFILLKTTGLIQLSMNTAARSPTRPLLNIYIGFK